MAPGAKPSNWGKLAGLRPAGNCGSPGLFGIAGSVLGGVGKPKFGWLLPKKSCSCTRWPCKCAGINASTSRQPNTGSQSDLRKNAWYFDFWLNNESPLVDNRISFGRSYQCGDSSSRRFARSVTFKQTGGSLGQLNCF